MKRLIVFVGMLLLVSAPAWGSGLLCPTDQGACFFELQEGFGFSIFTEEEFIQFEIVDSNNDFIRVDPIAESFVHIAESDAEIMYCPFPWWQEDPPWNLCVVGRGHVSANGRPADFTGLCPGEVSISGTGDRILDDTAFLLSGRFLVTENRQECVVRKVSITAQELD
jgi:hypothetical protein